MSSGQEGGAAALEPPPERMERRLDRALAALVIGGCAFLLFVAVTGQSFTVDEPFHLLAGLEMHQQGQNLVNLEHPPLVKWLAAWPLAGEPGLAVPPIRAGEVMATWQCLFADPLSTFSYLWRSRAILAVLVAAPFLFAVFRLGRRFGGRRTGLVLAACAGMAPTSLPYLALSQTDGAVALGFALTLLAAAAFLERPGALRAAGLGLAVGLALAAKFSAVLLAPPLFVLAFRTGQRHGRRAAWLALAGLLALGLLWGTYRLANPRYQAERGRLLIADYCRGTASLIVGDRLAAREAGLLELERISPEAAQFATGLFGVRAQNELGVYATVVFGELRSASRWYFFPLLLISLTPLLLLAASAAALADWWRRGRPWRRENELPALTVAAYLGVALMSSYNVGIRHLLPIFPLLFLPAAAWCARTPRRALVVVSLLFAESLALAPGWISATNTWWLGERNPTRTAFSTMAYKQSYYQLGAELAARGIAEVRVFQPIVFDRELQAYLPGARAADPAAPLAPGWYAVYIQAEQLLPALFAGDAADFYHRDNYRRAGRPYFERWQELVSRGEDHGFVAGNTFHLYRVP